MDELGNSESTFFIPKEPAEQTLEKVQEKARIKAGEAIIEQLIKRFEERIEFYSSIRAIQIDFNEDPDAHRQRVSALQQVVAELKEEKEYHENLLSSAK